MQVYVIDDHKVTVHSAEPTAIGESATVIRSLADLAGGALSARALVGIWNGLPGVAPVKRFKNHETAVDKLWAAFADVPIKGKPKTTRRTRDATRRPGPPRRDSSKQAKVISLLRRPEGATLDVLMAATNWQRHSVRGVLADAVKKRLGLTIVSEKEPGAARVYRIAESSRAQA